jgi:hypothetical protein
MGKRARNAARVEHVPCATENTKAAEARVCAAAEKRFEGNPPDDSKFEGGSWTVTYQRYPSACGEDSEACYLEWFDTISDGEDEVTFRAADDPSQPDGLRFDPALNSTVDTPEMGERVRAAAESEFDGEPADVFFEHGQWWVRFERPDDAEDVEWFESTFGSDGDEVTFSVVDEKPGADGFGFERV